MRLLGYQTFASPLTLCSLTLPTHLETKSRDSRQMPALLVTLAWKGGYISVVDTKIMKVQKLSCVYPSGPAFVCNMVESALHYFAERQFGCPAYQEVSDDLKLEIEELLKCRLLFAFFIRLHPVTCVAGRGNALKFKKTLALRGLSRTFLKNPPVTVSMAYDHFSACALFCACAHILAQAIFPARATFAAWSF